jgi:hypothetical protein
MTEGPYRYERDFGLVQQVRDLGRRMAEDENEARDAAIEQRKLEKRISELEKQAASWVGGFWTLTAAGTVVTFIVAFWDKITFGLRHP